MKVLQIFENNINERFMDQVIEALNAGEVIIYPTDTLYALGCDALNNNAIQRICRIKGINPEKTNLSIICSDLSQAAEYARIDNRAFRILKNNLPGAFTFILPASTTLPKVFKGRKTVGVRIPANAIPCEIAARLGNPILTTSVEVDEDNPAEGCEPESIAMHYEDVASLIIDGGEGNVMPSTVVDLTDSSDPEVVREGAGELEV
ncbi:MAG: threonylcarbamoyl-AMP synthase [Muribaculaceae bacterium]|nr:threonylcarbamoyl-AMP synthase [Muribaculaceae bacterium]MBR4722752.1 threonylcarbamoyl-AMP synthase [Muribaculaceae bacterium]MBR5435715.1 threonylcarbamoyl-AMP synthase [Muribaculaceae bacterium]